MRSRWQIWYNILTLRNFMKKLTIRQKGFLKDYILTLNATEAAWRNYNVSGRKSAKVMGSKLLRDERIKTQIRAHFQPSEIVNEDIAKALQDALNATKIKKYKGKWLEIPDHATRLRTVKLAIKCMVVR